MKEPKLYTKILDSGNLEDIHIDELIHNYSFTKNSTKQNFSSYRFDSCLFEKLECANFSFDRCEFVDCIFDHCDFSNAIFEKAIIHRCTFKSCNLVGIDMSAALLNNVSFIESKLTYANLAFCQFNTVHFIDSLLREAELHTIEQKKLVLSSCDCTKANFFSTKMNHVDVSTSNIDGILISPDCIEGLSVNSSQAVELASILGIQVVD